MFSEELYARCIPFDNTVKGRIGGNPPKSVSGPVPDDYKFYATIVHHEKENRMISIFIHNNFDTLLKNNIYPSIAIKIMEHEYSEMGSDANKALSDFGMNSISGYEKTQKEESLFIKTGGEPRFIQNESYYHEELEKDGYSFFLQIDEDGYSDDLLTGNYPFAYGALYLHRHRVTEEIIAGFWQYS
jgi:hypothetical protein